jgi:hypothetical protein
MYKTQGRSAAQLDPWRTYAAERADVHDFLASLTPAQWDAQSLCQGWRVRDVAVHMLVDEPVEQLGLPLALVKAAWFRFSVTGSTTGGSGATGTGRPTASSPPSPGSGSRAG